MPILVVLESGTSILQKPNKGVSILFQTYINLDQIHHIRYNWLSLIFFFSSADSHTEGLLILLHLGLEGVTEVDIDAKGGLCPLRLLSLMTEFSVFMPLQGIAPGNSWLGGFS